MNATDAAFVIDYLQASFPGQLDEGRVVVWLEELSGRDRDLAVGAVRKLRSTVDFIPTHRQFAEAYDDLYHRAQENERHRERMDRASLSPSPGNQTAPPESALTWLRQMRSTANLKRRRGEPQPVGASLPPLPTGPHQETDTCPDPT